MRYGRSVQNENSDMFSTEQVLADYICIVRQFQESKSFFPVASPIKPDLASKSVQEHGILIV